MKKLLGALLIAISSLANAQVGCSSSDLSGVSILKCSGYVEGNLLSGNKDSLSFVQNLFAGLGYSNISTNWVEKLSDLNGTNTIDFNTTLSGTSIIGIHKGGAGDVQSTAFYVVDAGTGLDKFKYNLAGSSSATIYSLDSVSPIPEPSTPMMLATGMCIALWMSKRKQNQDKKK